MSASACSRVVVLLAACAACDAPDPHWRFGTNVTGLVFTPVSTHVGVYPSTDVLVDPANPFRDTPLSGDMKWQLLADGGPVAAFYAFATMLAREPTGENQFYAASALQQAWGAGAVTEGHAEETRVLAIAAFQSMLDHFPDALGYDATGTTSYRLATPAYKAILDLGGKVTGDWILVTSANGGTEAVRASDPP